MLRAFIAVLLLVCAWVVGVEALTQSTKDRIANYHPFVKKSHDFLPGWGVAKPKFCKAFDCPEFEARTHPLYQLRYYPKYTWASVDKKLEDGDSLETAKEQAYDMLKKYFDGGNKNQTKIPMTAPVLTRVGGTQASYLNVTVSLWLDKEYAVNPPEPLDTSPIYIQEIEEMTVSVEEFGGYVFDSRLKGLLLAHQEEMNILGVEFRPNFYYIAEYDPPFELFGRHNEIWTHTVKNMSEIDNIDN